MNDTREKDIADTVGQLLAVLAHEIRNPLGNMENAITLLQHQARDVDLVLDAAQFMKRQVSRIARLIDDLFDISVIDQGKLVLRTEPISVNKLMAMIAEDSSSEMEKKRHSFSVDLLKNDVKINGDFSRLMQVFCNLLNNASKYTPDGGVVYFTAKVREDRIVFVVQDNGIGIEKAALNSIFQLFSQEMRAIGRGGLGLGLTLVKKLVEIHDGRVAVFSSGPGKGSRFEVNLPIYVEPSQGNSQNADVSKKVLLVEDHKDAATALKKIMEMEGSYDVRLAVTGQDAIQEALRFNPDIVLLDLGLPDMSGESVARVLRKRFPDVCIVVMTGYMESEFHDGWLDHYMVKPIDFPSLFRILSGCRSEVA